MRIAQILRIITITVVKIAFYPHFVIRGLMIIYTLLIRTGKHTLAEYAFYKNYFDRFTADLAFYYNYESTCKKPNYKGFYKEQTFKTFYKEIVGAEEIIKRAHELRNANPMSHSSAGLIDKSTTSNDIKRCIEDLNSLIDNYRTIHCW